MIASKITAINGCWELVDKQIQARIHLYSLCKIPVVKVEQSGQEYKLTILYNKKEEIVSGTITFQNEKTLIRRKEVLDIAVLTAKKREVFLNKMTRAELKHLHNNIVEVEGGDWDKGLTTAEIAEQYVSYFKSKEFKETKYWFCDPESKSY